MSQSSSLGTPRLSLRIISRSVESSEGNTATRPLPCLSHFTSLPSRPGTRTLYSSGRQISKQLILIWPLWLPPSRSIRRNSQHTASHDTTRTDQPRRPQPPITTRCGVPQSQRCVHAWYAVAVAADGKWHSCKHEFTWKGGRLLATRKSFSYERGRCWCERWRTEADVVRGGEGKATTVYVAKGYVFLE